MVYQRCGNFSIEVEEVHVTGSPVVLRVPVRRCSLAERMIALLSETDQGRDVAHKLIIDISNQTAEPDAATEPVRTDRTAIRTAFGPDLEAINSADCTIERCRESCTPSYRTILLQFGHAFEEDPLLDFGCLEGADLEQNTIQQRSD
jgi:hypothetical protein